MMNNSGHTISPSVNILQWNCRTLNNKTDEFQQFLTDNKSFDVLALQSVGTKRLSLPILPGFHYPPYTHVKENKIRCAMYVKKNILVSGLHIPNLTNGHAIQIQLSSGTLTIINVYYPEGISNKDELVWLNHIPNTKSLVVGDFNIHSALWDSNVNVDCPGATIFNECLEVTNLCFLNDGMFTRLPQTRREKPSAIDLTLISPGLFLDAYWECLDETLNSDHFMIQIIINSENASYFHRMDSKFIFERANWPLFRSRVELIDFSNNYSDIDDWYNKFQSEILRIADETIPKTNANPKNFKDHNKWWNEDCKISQQHLQREIKKYKKRQCPDHLDSIRKLRIEHKYVIAKAKQDYWARYISRNVDDYKGVCKVFNKLKEVKNRLDPPEQPLEVNGVKTTSLEEKADILADTFASVSQNRSLPDHARDLRTKAEHTNPKFDSDNLSSESPFSILELNQSLLQIKNTKKATGQDPLSYTLIKHLPTKAKSALLGYFNHLFGTGAYPSKWKEATVHPILKPGKARKDPKSYRPISLTPHVSKIYERLIKNRLEYFFESKNLIPRIQSGFRKGRSCTENIIKLTAHIKKGITNRRPVMATFFDLHRAYDTVWHHRLLQKLFIAGVSKNVFLFFENFLKNRSLKVKIGAITSRTHHLDMGIPQGSITAPIAFSLMLADIANLKLKHAHISLYADDLVLWSTNRYRRLNTEYFYNVELKTFQENVNQISNYMTNNGFMLSSDKTTFVVFGPQKIEKEKTYIRINDKKVSPSNEVKYLGVILDKNLTFSQHIKNLITKAKKAFFLLKLLKAEIKYPAVDILRTLVITFIRSRLSYGQEVFFAACPSLIGKLQSCETALIKRLLDLPQIASPQLVYREIGLLPLDDNRLLQTTKTVLRLKSNQSDVDEELSFDFLDTEDPSMVNRLAKNPSLLSRGSSIMNYTSELISLAGLGLAFIEMNPDIGSMFAPWDEPQLDIQLYLDGCKKSDNPALLKSFAQEVIHNHRDFQQIFTDGSKSETGEVGCAIYHKNANFKKSIKLNKDISIFSAELFAIKSAIDYIYNHTIDTNFVIFSDSRSALQALLASRPNRPSMVLEIKTVIDLLQKQGRTLKFIWIPSHCDIQGNDSSAITVSYMLPLIKWGVAK